MERKKIIYVFTYNIILIRFMMIRPFVDSQHPNIPGFAHGYIPLNFKTNSNGFLIDSDGNIINQFGVFVNQTSGEITDYLGNPLSSSKTYQD